MATRVKQRREQIKNYPNATTKFLALKYGVSRRVIQEDRQWLRGEAMEREPAPASREFLLQVLDEVLVQVDTAKRYTKSGSTQHSRLFSVAGDIETLKQKLSVATLRLPEPPGGFHYETVMDYETGIIETRPIPPPEGEQLPTRLSGTVAALSQHLEKLRRSKRPQTPAAWFTRAKAVLALVRDIAAALGRPDPDQAPVEYIWKAIIPRELQH